VLSWRVLLAVVCVLSLLSFEAEAAPRRKRRARRPTSSASSGPLTVPVEVAAGPIALLPSPPLLFDQPVHAGLRIEIAAVVDRALLRANAGRLPPFARRVAGSLNEVKVRPSYLALLPEELILSPQFMNTGMYGAIWRPLGLGIGLVDQPGFRVRAGAAVDAVALVVHSTTVGVPAGSPAGAQSFTLVVRPGLNATLAAEVPLSKEFLVSAGWASDFFVPQAIGRPPWEIFPLENSLFHLGGPYVMLHGRFPYTVGG
jgi:hypothetical protein